MQLLTLMLPINDVQWRWTYPYEQYAQYMNSLYYLKCVHNNIHKNVYLDSYNLAMHIYMQIL